jgi:glutathione S-transferase
MLILYYAPVTCALASHLALAHARAEFDLVRIDFSRIEQRSRGYLKINPKGRVPALVTERGILTETPAMLQYIAHSYPEAKLAPIDDWYELAQMNSFNSYLCSTVHVAHAHRMRGHRWADEPSAWEAMQRKVPQSVGEAFGLVENEFLRGPWVLGEQFSVSDYYLLTLARWLEADGADLTRLPRILAHRARVLELPLVKRIIQEEES